MTRRRLAAGAAVLALGAALVGSAGADAKASRLEVSEYRLPAKTMDVLRQRWLDQLERRYGAGSWAPMRFELGDRELELMGLPSKETLLAWRARGGEDGNPPTTFARGPKDDEGGGNGGGKGGGNGNGNGKDGSQSTSPKLISVAGTGFFGIRPGAWLLLIGERSIGWCSLAHVYGSPGSYDVSTAGHCGEPGDVASVIGAVGDRHVAIMDFGKFGTSHDGGIGNDWALIDVKSAYQHLVTPTMAFWGGPKGVFTKEGAVVGVNVPCCRIPPRDLPSVSVDPDPFLAQPVLHYGHGVGVGTGGTPRTGAAIHWARNHFSWFGAAAPGDSGSGVNVGTGDSAGEGPREAAGILTHLYIDVSGRTGLGFIAGTRATKVSGTLANGQLLPYPVPAPGAP